MNEPAEAISLCPCAAWARGADRRVAHLVYWWPLVHGDSPSRMGQLYSAFLIKPLHLYQEGGHLGVLLFFLISGFVIFHVAQSDGRGAFAMKRTFRILPPLFFSLALMFVVVYFRDHFGWPGVVGNDTNRIEDFLLAATLLGRPLGAPDALSVIWSLFVEIAAYAAVAVALPLFRDRPIVACAVYAASANVLLAPSLFFDAWRKSGELFVYMFYIGVGGAIYLGVTKRTTLVAATTIGVIYALLFGVWYNVFYPARIWAPPHELWTSYVASLFLFFAGLFWLKRSPAIANFLGDVSYSLYLLHIPVGCVVLGFAMRAGLPIDGALLLALGVVLIASWISFRLIEQPAQRLGRWLLARSRPGATAVESSAAAS